MPTYTTTTRRALRWLTGSNLIKDIDAGFQAIAEDVDQYLIMRSYGTSVISASGTRAGGTFGALSNGPDQVANVVLPTNGEIHVSFRATWQESVAVDAQAAIFIGSN